MTNDLEETDSVIVQTQTEQSQTEQSQTEQDETDGPGFWDRLDSWAGEIEDPGRWPLMRDVLVFQGKLALDALRDLALSPVSIAAVLVGFMRDKDRPGRYFYPLMKTGKRSDTVINLFGAADHAGLGDAVQGDPSIDELVERLETLVVKEFETGGLTAQAKDAIDRALDKAHQATKREAENLNAHIREEANRFRQASESKSEGKDATDSKDSVF